MELAAPGARRRFGQFDRRVVLASGCALVALAAAGAAVGIAGAAGDAALGASARGLIVGVPIAVGLSVSARSQNGRFGLLLAVLGAVLLVATLGELHDDLAYSIGRIAGWVAELLLIYLLLSFPTGRLSGETDRVLMGAAVLIVLTAFVPRIVLADHFDVPSPYTSCTGDCPANAFFGLGSEPAFVDGVVRPAAALLVLALSAAVVLRLWERVHEATDLGRRMLLPLLAVGVARMLLLGGGFAARQAAESAWPVQAIAWGLALAAPAIAVALLVAILRWELYAAKALEQLAEWVRELPDRATLGRALAEAFGDPTLRIAPAHGAGAADPEPGRAVSEVREHGEVVAVVTHDEALRASPRVLDAGLAMVAVVLDNQRLASEAQTATREVERSRARIAATAERERRRIERDLHDGAQQRLVALRIELELAEEVVRRDPAEGIVRLQELEHEVDEALEELRSLAHGVYPPLLADRGLTEALLTVAARWQIPVRVEAEGVSRYQPESESAVYFCVLEALQNVLKHAAQARHVVVRLDGRNSAELLFSVRDDGAGAPDGVIKAGAGITNMRDRLAAAGGVIFVDSRRAVGTVVRGRIPTPDA